MRRSIGFTIIVITAWSAMLGCETTDRMLTGAERAVTSQTGQTVIDLVEGKDPKQIAKKRLDQYARDPEALLRDIRAAQKDLETLLDALGVKVGEKWGKKEVKLPEQKKYVKVGRRGSPNSGFQIAARQSLDTMESTAGWVPTPNGVAVCVDYVDFLRGTASLRVSGATKITKTLPDPLDLSDATAALTFTVKSATATGDGQLNDTGFTCFVADAGGKRVTWKASDVPVQDLGHWQVFTCPMITPPATVDPGVNKAALTTVGFESLQTDWVYRFDSLHRDFAPPEVALKDVLALDLFEDSTGWSVPVSSTGSVGLDGDTLFSGHPTVKIAGPGDAVRAFPQARDLLAYASVTVIASAATAPTFFLTTAGGKKAVALSAPKSLGSGWHKSSGELPFGDPDLASITGYGFTVAAGKTLNVAQILVQLDLSGTFFILGGDAGLPGRFYLDGVACQREAAETYYSQRDYPEAPALGPLADNRVDLVYVDVWQRHVTSIEDPDLREVALGGPDTCTRVQTIAQVKLLKGEPTARPADALDCDRAKWPTVIETKFRELMAAGSGRLSTLASPPTQPASLCEIAPDSDYLGLDNRLYRVEIHDPKANGGPVFKWSKDNGAIAVAVVEDVVARQTPQTIKVERLGRDRATTIAKGDLVEISDDLTDLADTGYDGDGLPIRQLGELRSVTEVDPDANTITLDSKLRSGYTVARHAKVRRWDGQGLARSFVDTATTPWLDFGDGVRISFDIKTGLQAGDYWQFTARGITGQVEKLDQAPPLGVLHHYCPLALIRWKDAGAGKFEIADIADCRPHLPGLTELQGTDVGYDDGCCGLAADEAKLAAWHGDVFDGPIGNVQQALDALCAREKEYLVLRYVSGDGQEGLPGDQLPSELVVAVENVLGEPQAGVDVTFTVDTTLESHGGLSDPLVQTKVVQTLANGEARVTWTLGTDDGVNGLNRVKASLEKTPQAVSPNANIVNVDDIGEVWSLSAPMPEIIFNARVQCARKICYDDQACNLDADTVQEALETICEREKTFLTLRYVGGDGQEGIPTQPLPMDLVVAVENVLGEPQNGIQVDFAVQAGGGTVSASSVPTVNGEARVTWALGAAPGLNQAKASLHAPQAQPNPEIIFNARGVVPSDTDGCCCIITVGDGETTHGHYAGKPLDRYAGLVEALTIAAGLSQRRPGIRVCLLAGVFRIEQTIPVVKATNLVIIGSWPETVLESGGLPVLAFSGCNGVEVRDLRSDGLVGFVDCSEVVLERCHIDIKEGAGALLIENVSGSCVIASSELRIGGGVALTVQSEKVSLVVRDNRFTGLLPNTRIMRVVNPSGSVLVHGNRMQSRLDAARIAPISIAARDVAFHGNYCMCQAVIQSGTHVSISVNGDATNGSASATANHCLETVKQSQLHSLALIGPDPLATSNVIAIGNVTTNGVFVGDAGTAQPGNLLGILGSL